MSLTPRCANSRGRDRTAEEFDMPKGTCSIEGCDRPGFAKTWCHAHYNRWKRNGDTGAAHVQSRRTSCSVAGCADPHYGNGYCQTHRYRAITNGNPLVTRKPGSPSGEDNPAWLGDNVEYQAVHRRLRVLVGPASTSPCVDCGDPAHEWAYQHGAVDERVCRKTGMAYSTDPADYAPMCRSCHRRLDALHRTFAG